MIEGTVRSARLNGLSWALGPHETELNAYHSAAPVPKHPGGDSAGGGTVRAGGRLGLHRQAVRLEL